MIIINTIIKNTYKWLNIVNVKLSDMQLKKLKTVVKNKTGTTLIIGLKIFKEMIYLMNYY